MSIDCQQFEELAGAYAVWALPLQERMLAEAHVRDCKRCRQMACALQTTAHQLPFMVAPMSPGPHVRRRIMAAIEAEAAKEEAIQGMQAFSSPSLQRASQSTPFMSHMVLPPSHGDNIRLVAEPHAPTYHVGERAFSGDQDQAAVLKGEEYRQPELTSMGLYGSPRSFAGWREQQANRPYTDHEHDQYMAGRKGKVSSTHIRKGSGWRSLAIAAVLLFCLSGGITYWNWHYNSWPGSGAHSDLRAGVRRVQRSGTPGGSYGGGADFSTFQLQGLNGDRAITGQAAYFPQQHRIVLLVHHLRPLYGTQIYQGWLLRPSINTPQSASSRSGKPVQSGQPLPESVGVFVMVKHSDQAELRFTVPGGDIRAYSAIAISQEPGPYASTSTPQGQVVAMGSLQTSHTNHMDHMGNQDQRAMQSINGFMQSRALSRYMYWPMRENNTFMPAFLTI